MTGPLGLRERVVRRIANQEVAEAVGLVAGEVRSVGPDHVAADERGETALEEGIRRLGSELADRAAMELRSLDGCQHEQGALVAGQALEAGGEQRVDRLRHRASPGSRPTATQRTPSQARSSSSISIASSSSANSALPSAASAICVSASAGSCPRAEQVRDQPAAVAVVQGLQQQRRRVELAAGPGGIVVEQLESRHADQQDRRVARELRKVVDEVDERRLGPLQVVEHDHERAALSDRLEQLAHRPGRRLARAGTGAAEAERLQDQLGDQLCLFLPGEQLGDRGARGLRVRRGLRAEDLPHDLGQRPVGDAFPVGKAVAVQHRRFRADLAHELLDQARLADPGRPQHGQEVARAILPSAREDAAQRAQLVLAADQRRIEAPRTTRRERQHLGDPQRVDRLAALDDAVGHALGDDRVAHEPMRRLADQDLARRGRLLEPLCEIHDLARHHQLAVLVLTGDHLAAVDADARARGGHPRSARDPD